MHSEGLFILVHVALNCLDVNNDHLAGFQTLAIHCVRPCFGSRHRGTMVSPILRRCTSLFSHRGIRHGSWAVSPFQADSASDSEQCLNMTQLCSHSSNELDFIVHSLNGFHKQNVTKLCKWEQKTVLWNSHSTERLKKKGSVCHACAWPRQYLFLELGWQFELKHGVITGPNFTLNTSFWAQLCYLKFSVTRPALTPLFLFVHSIVCTF